MIFIVWMLIKNVLNSSEAEKRSINFSTIKIVFLLNEKFGIFPKQQWCVLIGEIHRSKNTKKEKLPKYRKYRIKNKVGIFICKYFNENVDNQEISFSTTFKDFKKSIFYINSLNFLCNVKNQNSTYLQ